MSEVSVRGLPSLGHRLAAATAQLGACRSQLEESLYCIRQLRTVIRLQEIELAEQSNVIAHLQKKLQQPGHSPGVSYE